MFPGFGVPDDVSDRAGDQNQTLGLPSTSSARTGRVYFLTSYRRHRISSCALYVGIGLIQVNLRLSGATRSEPGSLDNDPEEINAVNRGRNT